MALYYLHWFDDAKWFYVFRSLPFTELTAAGAGLFAGALSERMKESGLLNTPVYVALLCIGIVIPYLKPILDPLSKEQLNDRWKDDVCLQSTPSSCGAASAATVFKLLGLNMQESELAEECLTSSGGTENWYIARAFRKRGFGVNYRIEKQFPPDLKLPAIAGVRVGNYGHFIAILERSNGVYITGDPLKGREEIPVDLILNAFDFTGFFMEIN
ncbi:cysteine peptidase family C39 domain-containing protein [Pontiellaceae bacterium B1224]|nr:cysteine peptidase family C39 domain-containing protein [Pontiellaceae bacterium B1224]